MSSEHLLVVIILMGISAVTFFAGEAEPNSRRTAAATSLLLVAAPMIAAWSVLQHASWGATTLAALCALLVAAPLLDRVRPMGLLVAASVLAVSTLHPRFAVLLHHLPVLSLHMSVLALCIAASLSGLIGSTMLPRRKPRRTHAATTMVGRICMALVVGSFLLKQPPQPLLMQALIGVLMSASLCALVAYRARHAQPLHTIGMGVLAGIVLAQPYTMAVWQVGLCALAAAYFALTGSKLTSALVVDDPHHLTGTILLPALLSMLVYGITQHMLAESIQWLGAAIGLGIVGSAIWPLLKMTLGMHTSPRLLREGLDAPLAP